ncbi:bifunctional aldolase/short-chain dehydrogenase [Candidatus Albibeggiatoa sp. nov. NOAA]|uniref:bifunctional aldolase/short-chain dehydrogenase n=1 Tax=Candidatus Albibeggiatoa sp. nov. NOAA TaxID=3162724 RepID=UPI0032F469A2|nr:bifunctional aldolase/short-chain dehydrogenase [Thiotrichaceae bacterium]
MQSLWVEADAQKFTTDLDLRVYTSRLLGQNPNLVLHGGGNTSVKSTATNLFGETEEVLYVKGSGWDLATIEAPGFAPVKLDVLKRMAALPELSDTEMVQAQRAAMLNPSAPNPSVEAILHAIIPFKFVDHTHADATVALTNTPDGLEYIKDLYGDRVLVVPYVMPGFILAKKIYELSQGIDWQNLEGMILMNHGVFTFSDDAKTSYENMIKLVAESETYLKSKQTKTTLNGTTPVDADLLTLAQIRREVSIAKTKPVIARLDTDAASQQFASLDTVATIATQGPLTPDHVIRTKRAPILLDTDIADAVNNYITEYKAYFERNNDGSLTCLNPAPCWAVWQNRGLISFGSNLKEANIVADIKAHTIEAIQNAEKIEKWQALPEKDIFEMEYWELEQAKLKKSSSAPEFQGKIALVTGAASGIGKACVERLVAKGAVVAALDINADIATLFESKSVLGIQCDMSDRAQVQQAVNATAAQFGGLDIVVTNAGIFPSSETIEAMNPDTWDKSMAINLSSHQALLQACVPYLRLGFDPAVIIMASKNVPAPGPGASAYSVAKAGLTQLARVAALELAKDNIRVNTLHPNAVFDTAIWTPEVLEKRAKHYGLTVEEYKTNNLLRVEVTSHDVAELACMMAGSAFAKTTGAQLPIDGGNERVI